MPLYPRDKVDTHCQEKRERGKDNFESKIAQTLNSEKLKL